MARSERLQVNNGWLVMKHKETYGGRMRLCQEACPEIIDLLQFLGDWVYYEMGAQFQVVRNKKVKIYPPFTGDEKRWHCTRQGDWKSTTPFQRENQQHRELFHEIHAVEHAPATSSCDGQASCEESEDVPWRSFAEEFAEFVQQR